MAIGSAVRRLDWTSLQMLRRKVDGFQLNEPEAALPFTARLAREQGWTLGFAGQVTEEYKRFVILAMAAGHPVTPSEAVDQVWHLHLVYTRSYWQDWCGQVLGAELHHGPTRGGGQEQAKFTDWYAATLDSYRRIFEEEPPPAIWPDPVTRFTGAGAGRWVDGWTHWIVPRPAWTRTAWWAAKFKRFRKSKSSSS